jgi:REP element-mobilizing transposase RayT
MPTHRLHENSNCFYFCTFTCYRWLNLIEITDVYDFFPKSINKLAECGFLNCGFVIMPNHIHLLIFAQEKNRGLNKALSEFKRFLAYEIVKRLKEKKQTELLQTLEAGVAKNEKLIGKRHQVFRLSFDAKELSTNTDILEILEYMHHNPVKGKWLLADDYRLYPHSSAGFYEKELHCIYPIWDYREMEK